MANDDYTDAEEILHDLLDSQEDLTLEAEQELRQLWSNLDIARLATDFEYAEEVGEHVSAVHLDALIEAHITGSAQATRLTGEEPSDEGTQRDQALQSSMLATEAEILDVMAGI